MFNKYLCFCIQLRTGVHTISAYIKRIQAEMNHEFCCLKFNLLFVKEKYKYKYYKRIR